MTREFPPLVAVYIALAILGSIVPLAAFVPWLVEHGFDVSRFASDLFANRISSFFGLDTIISAIVLTIFVLVQGARDRVTGRMWAVAATFTVGVSCGLPLFLALRERSVSPA